jgi:antitoxin component of MazEF toxin-antitoxin module
MIKQLIHHGNSMALVIDKAILQAAGLDEDTALFQITVDPNGGIVIQSVKAMNENLHKKAFREVLKENDALMKKALKK